MPAKITIEIIEKHYKFLCGRIDAMNCLKLFMINREITWCIVIKWHLRRLATILKCQGCNVQWRSQSKILLSPNIFAFKRATAFDVGTISPSTKRKEILEFWGENNPFADPCLRLWQCPRSPAPLKSSRRDILRQSVELWNSQSLECQPLLLQIEKSQLRWFGHVCPERPRKDWRCKSYWLPHGKSGQEFAQRPGEVITDCVKVPIAFLLCIFNINKLNNAFICDRRKSEKGICKI